MTAPGMVASSINETNEMSGSKSFNMSISMQTPTGDNNISPVIDTQRLSLFLIQNRERSCTVVLILSMGEATKFNETSLESEFWVYPKSLDPSETKGIIPRRNSKELIPLTPFPVP